MNVSAHCLAVMLLSGGLLVPASAQSEFPVKLSAASVPGGNVAGFKFSKDGRWIVYLADHDAGPGLALHSVPASGGRVRKLNPPLVPGGDVLNFEISDDGRWVVYRADQVADGVFELYSVPIEGGTAMKVNGGLVTGGDVLEFTISADGEAVIYLADQDIDQTHELFVTPIRGGVVEKLNNPLVSGPDVLPDFKLSEDGTNVFYRADQDAYGKVELYRVPLTGGVVEKLNAPLPDSGDVVEFQVGIPPAGDPGAVCVVYLADMADNQTFELYSVGLEGGSVVRLNGPLVAAGDVIEFGVDSHTEGTGRRGERPPSSRVIYRADQDVNQQVELYSVPIAGGPITKLNPGMVSGGDVHGFAISEDLGHVVYMADQSVDTMIELYSVAAEGGEFVKLNSALQAIGDVVDFKIGAARGSTGQWVVYRADQEMNQVFEIYGVPIGGGGVKKLNPVPAVEGDVAEYFLSPDGGRVCYLADQEVNGVAELFHLPIEGTGDVVKVNGVMTVGGDVLQFGFSPDGGRVVYAADQEVDHTVELYGWVTSEPRTYAEFAAFYALQTAPGEDEEGDGCPNLLEYVTGRNPGRHDAGKELLEAGLAGDALQLSLVAISPPAGTDLLLALEGISPLGHGGADGWEVIASRTGAAPWVADVPFIVVPMEDGLERVTFEIPVSGAPPKRFFRIAARLRP